MKRIGTALTIVFIIAGFAISFFIGHYVSDKSHTESRAAQFDKYISRAIDTIKDKGLSIDGAPEAIASNIWVAHEFCDSPEISAELSNLWNTTVYEKDVLLGQEDVLTAQLKDILEKCQQSLQIFYLSFTHRVNLSRTFTTKYPPPTQRHIEQEI